MQCRPYDAPSPSEPASGSEGRAPQEQQQPLYENGTGLPGPADDEVQVSGGTAAGPEPQLAAGDAEPNPPEARPEKSDRWAAGRGSGVSMNWGWVCCV